MPPMHITENYPTTKAYGNDSDDLDVTLKIYSPGGLSVYQQKHAKQNQNPSKTGKTRKVGERK